jgi:hypothetical protein
MIVGISTAANHDYCIGSRGILVVAIVLTFAGTANSQTADDYRRLGQDAGKVIGAYEGAITLLELCAAKFPNIREEIKRRYQGLEVKNISIVSMSRSKLYARSEFIEGVSSRARIDKMFNDLRNQLRTNLASSADLKATCDASVTGDANQWKMQDVYPQEYKRIAEFKVGYPWKPFG